MDTDIAACSVWAKCCWISGGFCFILAPDSRLVDSVADVGRSERGIGYKYIVVGEAGGVLGVIPYFNDIYFLN